MGRGGDGTPSVHVYMCVYMYIYIYILGLQASTGRVVHDEFLVTARPDAERQKTVKGWEGVGWDRAGR